MIFNLNEKIQIMKKQFFLSESVHRVQNPLYVIYIKQEVERLNNTSRLVSLFKQSQVGESATK